jgi:membrane protein DedA with SNARE-associated domain
MMVAMSVIGEYAQHIVEFVKANETWAVPIVFALAFGESLAFISLVLPSTVVLLGIGGLIGASGIDFWRLWLAAGLGGSLGYTISYWAGAYFKDSIVRFWPFSRHPELLPRGERFFKRFGVLAVFFGHFFGPLRAVVPVVAGTYSMPQSHFQAANVSSSFLWALGVMGPSTLGVKWLLGH